MSEVLSELSDRGILAQVSDHAGLEEHLDKSSRILYCGFDPTAPSLHLGNLIPLLTLRRFQLAGHKPIALVGGATGLIGDPSGKSQERTLNEREVVEDWVERIRNQVARFVDLEGKFAARVVNNLEWTQELNVLDFLRDVGKHFSVNAMSQRESVKARLEREESGISYTEFSYMLLQANDYLELARRYGCSVQLGGSDQWGNIVSGVDLIRRILHKQAFAMTFELLVKSDGSKFGKTASEAIWLDPQLMTPYSFYQQMLNTADDDVLTLLDRLTFATKDERTEATLSLQNRPELRHAQQLLASALTALVHGEEQLRSAERITAALFGGEIQHLLSADFDQLWQDGLDRVVVEAELGLAGVVADAGLATSRSAARRLIRSGGISLDGDAVVDETAKLDRSQAMYGKYHLLRRGRKTWRIVGYS